MSFSKNTSIIGKHAFLSPSNYHWLDYDEDKLTRSYFSSLEAKRGSDLHDYAQKAISLGVKQADNGSTLSMYINDCIGFRMQPEYPLYYTDDCFGTADAVGLRNNVLRISDLKTGITPANIKQLLIYAGIFFLQYNKVAKPSEYTTILRIYQNDAIEELVPDPEDMLLIMSKIKTQASRIAYLREED